MNTYTHIYVPNTKLLDLWIMIFSFSPSWVLLMAIDGANKIPINDRLQVVQHIPLSLFLFFTSYLPLSESDQSMHFFLLS